ncbi:MAG: hypothetical protein KL787_08140 [Taibaiella sp.]|nr:hypothetical protein [Taibaiella sp.]
MISGKNIVSVVLACNGYEIIDLGVMVPQEQIISKAIEEQVDCHWPERADHPFARGNDLCSQKKWKAGS